MDHDFYSTYRDPSYRMEGKIGSKSRKKPTVNLQKFKKISFEKAYPRVREYVELYPAGQVFSKEFTSRSLDINVSMVERCFQQLNLDGMLSQRQGEGAHDCRRNHMFYFDKSGWAPDKYTKLK